MKAQIKSGYRRLLKAVFLFGLLFLTLWAQYLFVFQPRFVKRWAARLMNNGKSRILRVFEVSLLERDMDVKVLKRKKGNSLSLEFLSRLPDGSFRLINSVDLPGRYDGFFEYQKGTVSVGSMDQDGDGRLEIIAPTFDGFLRPHFNIVSYHPELNKFILRSKARPVRFQ